MPRVFLSYARTDLRAVRPIEHALRRHGIAVWRDQESLYGGQQWPKAIGAAIAAHDCVVLVWSESAARSYFVEFEWNSAIALRKPILPCLLDDTPLPAALSGIHAIDATHLDEALPRILQALRRPVPPPDPGRRAEVIAQLGALPSTAPEEVVQTAKAIFAQHGWSVHGSVYQAGRDFHLTIAPPESTPAKTIVERWQTWVALCVGVLTMTTLAADLPGTLQKLLGSGAPGVQVIEQPLRGMILDEHQRPVSGVDVFLPEFNQGTTTDHRGLFTLHVTAEEERPVRVIARKSGYVTRDSDATLGNTSLSFTMPKEP